MRRKLFSPEDLRRIREAVQGAEQRTAGEIVPYIVEQSDFYEEALWRCGGVLALLSLVAVSVLTHFTDLWLPIGVQELSLVTMVMGGAGATATYFSSALRRLAAGEAALGRRVMARAIQAFVSEEVFTTRDRTGILIFISLLEHRVVVMGDAGINAKVEQHEWDRIVELIISGIKRDRAVEGLLEAIHACGQLLEQKGVARRNDDRDELSDELRMGEEKP
jgi:putative membrane protein